MSPAKKKAEVQLPTRVWRQRDYSRVWAGPILRPQQEAAIQEMMQSETHSICNGSTMDTGKTVMAIEFMLRMGFTYTLTIGVKDTFAQWDLRMRAQSDDTQRMLRIDATVEGQKNLAAMLAGTPGHYFAGAQYITAQDWELVVKTDDAGNPIYEVKNGEPKVVKTRKHLMTFKRAMAKHPLQLLNFDEMQMVANRKSLGGLTLKTIPTDWKHGMSGTWFGNKFENAWSITRWLWPDLISTRFSTWMPEWCETAAVLKKGGQPVVDSRGNPVTSISGEKEPGKFITTLPCYIALDGERDVPDPELVYVELTAQQRVDYEALEQDGMVWLATHKPGVEPLVTNMPVVKRTRLRQATLGTISWGPNGEITYADNCESSKLFALRGVLERPDWFGRQAGIYTHSKEFAKLTLRRMQAAGYNVALYSGDQTSNQRDEIKRAFLAGEIQFLISVIAAFSTGLDGFQKKCNRVVWMSEEDNNMLNNQAIKRYFRSGDEEMLNDFKHVKIVAHDTYDLGVLSRNTAETARVRETIMPMAA